MAQSKKTKRYKTYNMPEELSMRADAEALRRSAPGKMVSANEVIREILERHLPK